MSHSEKEITQSIAIDIKNLTKSYAGKINALNGITFSVKQGAIFSLLGPNGAGKSTAVKMMTTLTKPDDGTIQIAGKDVVRHAEEVRLTIGSVAQKSGVDLLSTGRENLTLQGKLYGLRGQKLKQRVSELLERFGLADAANRVARTYSGGMQRKLDIAMGIIHHPQILFLDEPTTGLDPEARSALWHTIQQLTKDDDLTVLLTTHYLEEADFLADQLVIIDEGKVVVEGSPEELKGDLHGDVLQIELTETDSHVNMKQILHGIENIHEIIEEKKSLYLRVNDGTQLMPVILGVLEKSGINVNSTVISRPTLDDVYLHYTGKTLSDFKKEEHE
ncbi:ATP-binding cassette domain-containing protein [Virgibacillus oceani]